MFVRVKKCSAGVVPSESSKNQFVRDWRSFTCRTPDSLTNLSRCLVANITPDPTRTKTREPLRRPRTGPHHLPSSLEQPAAEALIRKRTLSMS